MSEKIKGFSIELDLDHLSIDRGLKGLKDNIKTVNSEMKRNMSAFDYAEKSTKKYETSLSGLNKKFEVQKKVVSAAQSEYEKMVSEHGKGSKEAEKAAREYNNQAAALSNLERHIGNTTKEMQEFERQQRIANSGWTRVGDVLHSTGDKLIGVGKATQEVGGKLTKNVSVPLGLIGGIAIKTGSDFQAGMSKVGAVSGASADDMAKLEKKAREMGATTVFSAKEASDAFYYMSLAGWDAQDSMDGIAGVMDLAAASGEDLASVADIVTDGLTAFGLKAKDSGRMADVLAAASSNANTDVSGLGQAFAYVAPVAGALGYTMEDTSKAIGLMANAGIKSSKAGTALRTMMTNLAKPTDAMQVAMTKYGISLTDSKGKMKTLDEVMLDLRKGLGGLDKDQQAAAASTIFGKEAMSGALAIVNASEEDYKKLSKAIKESDGSAKKMADTMQDNLQGSIKGLKSMLEDLFIEMYKNLNPMLDKGVNKAKDLTRQFADLSPETQGLITKFGLLAFASGPVISGVGKVTEGLGHTFKTVGDVSKAIGIASNGGTLAAALASLGPGAIARIAIAGIGAVAYGIHQFNKKAREAEEVNLDLANSFIDQANELEKNADTFDRLSAKAKISNEELSQLNDLNIKISKSSNPGEIEQLQYQYNKLAEKSGLSKDELKELFKANQFLIEQSPDVQRTISEEGNSFVESTNKVREYINTLYDMSRIELEAERTKQLANEKKIRDEIIVSQEKEKEIKQGMNDLMDAYNGKVDDSKQRISEINERLLKNKDTQEVQNALIAERQILQAIENGDLERASELYTEHIVKSQEALEKQKEKTSSKQEELNKIEAIDGEMANIILKQAGINEEGEKGLAQLDETIAKNREELSTLEEKQNSAQGLTDEEQNRYNKLLETNNELLSTKQYLYDELGIYKDINSLANTKLSSLDQEKQKKIESLAKSVEIENTEQDIIKALDSKNKKLTEEKAKLEENRKKQGANKAEIDKQITSIDEKLIKQAVVKKELLKELGIWGQLDQKTKDGINSEINKGKAVGDTSNKLDAQGNKIDANNKKTDLGIEKEKQRSAEAGKDIYKNVQVTDNGSVNILNKKAMEKKNKPIDITDPNNTLFTLHKKLQERKIKPVTVTDGGTLDALNKKASSPVTKVINFIGKGLEKLKFWADGTPPSGHPGGPAVVGDGGGRELIQLPNGRAFLSPDTDTMLNLPKGTQVTDHRTTAKLLNNIPKYAKGTGGAININTAAHGQFSLDNLDRLNFAAPINSSFDRSMVKISSHIQKNFNYLGKESVGSIAKGFNSNSIAVEMATKEMNARIENINRIANDRLIDTKKNLEKKKVNLEKQTLNQLDKINKKAQEEERDFTKEEKLKMEAIEKVHKDNLIALEKEASKEIKQIEENKTRALELLPERITKATIRELEKRTDYEEKSIYGQFKKWSKLQDEYIKKEKDIAKQIKVQKNDVAQAEKAKNEKLVKSRTETLNKLLEKEKENNEKLKEAESESLRYKQEIYNELNTLNTEYVSKVQAINNELIEEEKKLRGEYQKTLDDRTNSLYSFAGIFDEIKEKEKVSGQELINNLKGQVTAFDDWANEISSLSQRGIDEGLLEELRAMGPKAGAEIAALNALTDEELEQYNHLWRTKSKQAREQAEKELIGMKEDTQKQINELRKQSEKQLDELEIVWRIKVQNIRFGVKEEFDPMTADLKQIGANSIEGMIDGLSSMEGALMAKANSIANAVKNTISSAFDIHSPSRWMRDEIGKNMVLGWVEGIDSEKRTTLSKAKEMSEWMKPNLGNKTGNEWLKNLFRNSEFARLLELNSQPNAMAIDISSNNTDLKEVIGLMKEFIQAAESSKGIKQTNHYHSTGPLSPSEITRRNKQMLQQFAEGLR